MKIRIYNLTKKNIYYRKQYKKQEIIYKKYHAQKDEDTICG